MLISIIKQCLLLLCYQHLHSYNKNSILIKLICKVILENKNKTTFFISKYYNYKIISFKSETFYIL